MAKRMTQDEFIRRSKEVHGDKYDYSKVDYKGNRVKVCIICPEHGEFWQNPYSHLTGRGCSKCNGGVTIDRDTFIKKAKEVHGDKYNYSKVEYVNTSTPVCIICPEHGEFWQTPHHHLGGSGCQICGGGKKLTKEDFIAKAKEMHRGKYDYSKVEYMNNHTKVCIICPEHGEFWQIPSAHLVGQGCPKCKYVANGLRNSSNTNEFVEKAKKIHGNRYNYLKVNYKNNRKKVIIICPKHGEFYQAPEKHLMGQGCPVCGRSISKCEFEIYDYVCDLIGKENVVNRTRSVIAPYEIDIFIPSMNLGIEYDGLYWHSEDVKKTPYNLYHKTELCKEKGIKLIHIFEDEYIEHKEIVLEKIKNILKCNTDKKVIGARKCIIKEINNKEAKPFLEKYHIQGYVGSTIYLGGYYNDELVSVMSFLRESKTGRDWNLTRFTTNTDFRLPGIASKMLKFFLSHYDVYQIKTFLDRRWNIEGNTVYEKIGFKLDKIEKPDYYYVVDGKRCHKFGFRKDTLHKKYGLDLSLTESQMVSELNIPKIYNCGLTKYIYINE